MEETDTVRLSCCVLVADVRFVEDNVGVVVEDTTSDRVDF